MTGLQDISQLYHKWLNKYTTPLIERTMTESGDHSDPDDSTMDVELRKEPSTSESIQEHQLNKDSVDPCASLEEVIALVSADHVPSPIVAP